jgi:hypothetical protein
VSTDETTNASGRKVADVIGVLKNNQMLSEKSFLLPSHKKSAVKYIIACVFY